MKKIIALILALAFVLCASLTVFAHDVPDLSRTGTINITLHCGETPVGGGTLSAYWVGEIYSDDGDFLFRPAGDFTDCGLSFEDITLSSLPAELASYIEANELKPVTTQDVAEDGTVSFTDLTLGLYLMVQETPAPGYFAAAPFLVSLPGVEEEVYVYEVDASPKVELEKEPTTEPSTTEPEEELPDTGQMKWPVPVLAVGGLTLLAAGWYLLISKRKSNEG